MNKIPNACLIRAQEQSIRAEILISDSAQIGRYASTLLRPWSWKDRIIVSTSISLGNTLISMLNLMTREFSKILVGLSGENIEITLEAGTFIEVKP